MSELTQCNYCHLQSIKHRAKQNGDKVVLRESMGGTNVYVIPKGVVLPLSRFNYKIPDKFFKAWFMEIGSSCCC